ncbi:helix-turn-helix domain-containing protein [Actinomycetospora sp. CA-101289]|uniref:AraC-like ligand-binding domain-containing protein n=1 Tax=Actinomycetospora sp. CA-101289 TaxID=3239893 RepID=UPI003D97EC15
MTVLLDSREIPAVDRDQAVREAVARMKVPLDIEFPVRTGPVVRGAFTDLGSVRVCSCRSNATRVTRTARLTRDDFEPSVFLALQKSGSSVITQLGRETVLRTGDLAVLDTTAPFAMADAGGVRQYLVRVPVDRLALPPGALRQVCAVRLSPRHPVADLTAGYFKRMASRPDLLDHPDGDAVGQPSIELIRAVISTHLHMGVVAAESLNATLRVRILEYVRAHLYDPRLNGAQVAAEHHISVRQLYKVLADGDVTFTDWIRERRLEECRTELSGPSPRAVTVEAVARRWGFVNMSSFSRAFRAAYGMSPRQWRDLHRTPAPSA